MIRPTFTWSPQPTRPHPDFGALNRNQRAVAGTLLDYFDANGVAAGRVRCARRRRPDAGLGRGGGRRRITAGIDSADKFLGALDGQLETGAGLPVQGRRCGRRMPTTPSPPPTTGSPRSACRPAMTPTRSSRSSPRRWNVWGTAYGGSEETGGDPGRRLARHHGTTPGAWSAASAIMSTTRWSASALGGGWSDFSLSDGLGDGSANTFNAGIYGRQGFGNAYVSGALAYGFNDVDTQPHRVRRRAQRRFRRATATPAAPRPAIVSNAAAAIAPYAAFQATAYHLPAYSETSSGQSLRPALRFRHHDRDPRRARRAAGACDGA